MNVREMPRASLAALAAVVMLTLAWASGLFRADRDIDVPQDRAEQIALAQIDFEPERTGIRFVRQGFDNRPVWAVSFTQADSDEVIVIRIDAESGEVIEVIRDAG